MTPRISHASNGYDEGSIKFDWCKNMSDHVRPCVWGHLRTQSSNDLVSFLAEDVTKRSESAPPPSSQRTMTATEDGRVLLFQSDFDRVPSFASHDPLHLAHCLAARKLCSTLASMDSQDHDSESNLEQHSAAWVPGRVPIRFENVTNSVAISSPSNFEDDINLTHQRNHAVACVGQVPSNTGTGSASTYHTIFTTSSGSTGTNTTAPKGLGLVHRHAAAETVTRAGNEAIVSLSPGGGKRREQKKQQHLEVTKVIRPNPVKTAPPGAAATRFAALPISGHDDNLRAEPKGSGILHADGPSVPLFSSPNHSEYSRGEGTGKTQLSEEAKEAAVTIPRQGSVLQEWQTTFPDNQVRAMAPSRMAVMDGNFVPPSNQMDDYTRRDMDGPGQASNNRSSVGRRPTSSPEDEQQTLPPTPLFERLVTEEVQELKAYARIIESQQRKLSELQKIHGDLEARLQVEAKSRQQLESTLEAREREWNRQLEHLTSDRNHWRSLVQVEEAKNTRLMEEVIRKEQEIRRMLQRKYDHEGSRSIRGARLGNAPERTEKPSSIVRSPEPGRIDYETLQGPHDILKASGSAEHARIRNSHGLLLDFFGL